MKLHKDPQFNNKYKRFALYYYLFLRTLYVLLI